MLWVYEELEKMILQLSSNTHFICSTGGTDTHLIPRLTLWNISRALFGRGTFGTFGDFFKWKPPPVALLADDAFGCGDVAIPLWCLNDSPRTTAGAPLGEPSLLAMSPPNDWLRVTIIADFGRPRLMSWTECPALKSWLPLWVDESFLVIDGSSESRKNLFTVKVLNIWTPKKLL